MSKCIVFIITSAILCHTAAAGDLDRAFRYINTGDYDKALQNIREELNDNAKNVAANYAMARLYSSKDFKQYNLDSATIYINKAYAAIPLNPEDKLSKKYLKLGVRDFTIKELFDEINQAAYEKAKAINSFESFDHFLTYSKDTAMNASATDQRDDIRFQELKIREEIGPLKDFLNNYPKSKDFKEADALYEKLLYLQIVKPGTYEAYKNYLDSFPTGPYVKDAKEKYEQKLFASYLQKNTLDAYTEFEKDYPANPWRASVQDSIYSLSTRSHTAADYDAFIRRYPGNKHIMDAWGRLFDLSTQEGRDSEFIAFQKKYPDNPIKDRVQQELYLSSLPLSVYKSNDKYGYVNPSTHVLSIEPQYAEASEFNSGLAAVALKPCSDSCAYSYIDKSGRIAFDKTFAAAGDFDNGRAIVATSYCDGDPCNYGIINRRGEFIINPIYQDIQPATEGLFTAQTGDKYGFIDASGKAIIPFSYQDATPFSDGKAGVEKDSVWIYIDHSGQQVFAQSFKNISAFSSGLAAVSANDSTYGYIDRTGNWAIPPTYEFAEPFDGDTAIVTIRDTNKRSRDYGLSFRYKIDKTGNSCYKLINPNAAVLKKKGVKKKKSK